MWRIGLIAVVAGCGDKVTLGHVEGGHIELVRGHLDLDPDRSQVELEISGGDGQCLDLSSRAEAEIDGIPMDLVYLGGWREGLIFDDGCTHAQFRLDDLPLDRDVSVVVIEDRGARVEFEVPHLRVPHELIWRDPEDGVLEDGAVATFDVVPTRPDVPFAQENDLSFALGDGELGFRVCTERGGHDEEETSCDDGRSLEVDGSSASFVAPAFCADGTWTFEPPWLGPEVPATGGFQVEALLQIDPIPVEVRTGIDSPACDVDLDDLRQGEVPAGASVRLDPMFVKSPGGPDGFFVGDGAMRGIWIEDPDELGRDDVTIGDLIALTGEYDFTFDTSGVRHDSIRLTSVDSFGGKDPHRDGAYEVDIADLNADLEGVVVALRGPTVSSVGPDGFVADGIEVGDWWVDPSAVTVGERLEHLVGIWHYDVSRGWLLLPRGEVDLQRAGDHPNRVRR